MTEQVCECSCMAGDLEAEEKALLIQLDDILPGYITKPGGFDPGASGHATSLRLSSRSGASRRWPRRSTSPTAK